MIFAGWSGHFSFAAEEAAVRINVRSDVVKRTIEPRLLAGGNLALWYRPERLNDAEFLNALERWKPGMLRMPGGSWSDEVYWNGNGVRTGNTLDDSRLEHGVWRVDYSDWAPGFRLKSAKGEPAQFHGHTDIKTLHEFIRGRGAETLVTVNMGTGTPEMASEWVRWANLKMGYKVSRWEVGNELDGEWEMGHFGVDGKPMTDAKYAKRFVEFSRAMKAVDPTIKVGGPACSNDNLQFVETLIREGGAELDFITFHTYPVLAAGVQDADRYAYADRVLDAGQKIRRWIQQYQPERAAQIEVGVTEWHKQVMETEATVDLSSGLWALIFLGNMVEGGVDFANQWDCFSTEHEGGHGLFDRDTGVPRAMFHALSLWTSRMGRQWLQVDGADRTLRVYASKEGAQITVLFVNTGVQARPAMLSVGGRAISGAVDAEHLTVREYLWNPHSRKPEWSTGARAVTLSPGADGKLVIPQQSALVVRVPESGIGVATPAGKTTPAGEPEIAVLLPEKHPADREVRGLVVLRQRGTKLPWLGTPDALAKIEVQGGELIGAGELNLADSAASFVLRASAPGKATVKASLGELTVERSMEWRAVSEKTKVIWEFADPAVLAEMKSNYQPAIDAEVRPNQTVLAVALSNDTGKKDANSLLTVTKFPGDLERATVGGVIAKLGASADLISEDPKAAIQVVLQSELDHWIPIAEIPLQDLVGKWIDLKARIERAEARDAMKKLYAIRFQLKAHLPVTGRIYIDDLGVIVRTE